MWLHNALALKNSVLNQPIEQSSPILIFKIHESNLTPSGESKQCKAKINRSKPKANLANKAASAWTRPPRNSATFMQSFLKHTRVLTNDSSKSDVDKACAKIENVDTHTAAALQHVLKQICTSPQFHCLHAKIVQFLSENFKLDLVTDVVAIALTWTDADLRDAKNLCKFLRSNGNASLLDTVADTMAKRKHVLLCPCLQFFSPERVIECAKHIDESLLTPQHKTMLKIALSRANAPR